MPVKRIQAITKSRLNQYRQWNRQQKKKGESSKRFEDIMREAMK